jgi:hypothetical protein
VFREGSPRELPLELIEREIERLAAQINAGNARWLELVAEFDRRQGWGGTGCRSTAEWVAWRCALTSRSAREHVRVARALPELPLIREAFGSGELSYSKVRALTRVADREAEEDLLALARHATAAQLERMVRAARRVTTSEADRNHRDSYVRWYWDDDDGCLHLDAKLPPEDGAIFLRALEAARDSLAQLQDERDDGSAEPRTAAASSPADGGSAEPPPPAPPPQPTNAESLTAMCDATLARPPTGLTGGDRYQLLFHVDASTLATGSPGASVAGPGSCAVADGPGISPETARRLACDCAIVAIAEIDGTPVGVGRRTRSIPPSLRRALIARDKRCAFPGCERHRFVDGHHIVPWAEGGATDLDNLCLLCRHHHLLVHEGGFSVARGADRRLVFRRPDGVEIPSSPPLPRAGSPPDAARPVLTGDGERMDLAACTDAVLAATGAIGPTAPGAREAGGPG